MAKKRPEARGRSRYLTESLREVHNDIDAARAVNSWSAVAALRRQALQVRAELDEIKRAEDAHKLEEHRLTDAELVEEIVAALEILPVSVVEDIMEACEQRVGPPKLRVVE